MNAGVTTCVYIKTVVNGAASAGSNIVCLTPAT
jgi:hypothetical protein